MKCMSIGRLLAAALLIVAAICLAGCAATRVPLPQGLEPQAVWQQFQAGQERLAGQSEDFSLSASMYLSQGERTNRTTMRLWGDAGALRMDVLAGIGTPLAYVAENASGLTVLYPSDKTATIQPDRTKALLTLGLALPFSLQDLSAVLRGRLHSLVAGQYRSVEPTRQDDPAGPGLVFRLGPESLARTLTLSFDGRPLALSGGEDYWTLRFPAEDDGESWPPTRLEASLPPDRGADLRVRELNLRQQPWPAEALHLELPPGITLKYETTDVFQQ